MKVPLPSSRRLPAMLGVLALVAGGSVTWAAVGAQAAPAGMTSASGTVLQTNLVSDLPGVADITDPNMQNPWGISESGGSPFWFSDNNSGLSTLYQVPGANSTPVSIPSLVVTVPTPAAATGGAPTGTVFNTGTGAFQITAPGSTGTPTTAAAVFLFDTEDGTIAGWNPAFGAGTVAPIAIDNSGNNFTNPDPNQQTGAVYKGLAIATSTTPIIPADANSTSLLYASNFRAATVDVYDAAFHKAMLPAGAFTDSALPNGFAPFNVQVLSGKVYVTYAKQDASKHDDLAGLGRGFVDVFNLDGTPGLPGGNVRLISRGALDSPWGLAIAPTGFAGLSAPNNDPVLLVGNFGNGWINAFDANTGAWLDFIKDSDGEPVVINELWALKVGNGGRGGLANTVYFTSGPFNQTHGIFGSLTTATPGSPEGASEAQWIQANTDVVNLDTQQLVKDVSAGASAATIQADTQALNTDLRGLNHAEKAFTADAVSDAGM